MKGFQEPEVGLNRAEFFVAGRFRGGVGCGAKVRVGEAWSGARGPGGLYARCGRAEWYMVQGSY